MRSSREHAPWAIGDYGFRVHPRAQLRRHFLQQLLQKTAFLPAELTEQQIDELFNAPKKKRATRSPSTFPTRPSAITTPGVQI